MRVFDGGRHVLCSCAVAALLAGCGGTQPPVVAPGALLQSAIATRASSTYDVLHRFTQKRSADGYYPTAPLIDVDGTLYGTTRFGGNATDSSVCNESGCGTVFSVSPSGAEHVLHVFTGGSDGAFPAAGLTAVKGVLYGTTLRGGSSDSGVVFSTSTTGVEHVLYSFAGGYDGSGPQAGLIYANGLLYGTTAGGGRGQVCAGSIACGTVFSVSTSGKETVLHRFEGGADDGSYPVSSLIEVNGTFYGTTSHGGYAYNCDCGTVFSISKKGTEKVVHDFAGGGGGEIPKTALVDVDGTMYGTTSGEGIFFTYPAAVFSVTPQGVVNTHYQFGGAVGPAGLIAVNGTLYGTTMNGGTCNHRPACGTIYSLSTSGGLQVLLNFPGGREGALPQAALLNVNGTLYGTTSSTRDHVGRLPKGVGTVFSLTL